ncbi:hypothetical protein [Arenimonas sp.]|uniref:hypothetical protein n=1 Tax=Arenimonas sp. TaxID=1872635 RepID=UPI0035B0A9D2
MPDISALVPLALYFGGPLWILVWLGYRYGYRQQVTGAGLLWRTLLFCSILGWSVAGGQSHDTGWAMPLPSIVALYMWATDSLHGALVIPPVWVVPLFHVVFYLLAVAYGYRSREKTYSPFPDENP